MIQNEQARPFLLCVKENRIRPHHYVGDEQGRTYEFESLYNYRKAEFEVHPIKPIRLSVMRRHMFACGHCGMVRQWGSE